MEQEGRDKIIAMAQAQSNGPRMRSISMDSECPVCKGSGWALTEEGELLYASECDCGLRKKQILSSKLNFANIPEAFRN